MNRIGTSNIAPNIVASVLACIFTLANLRAEDTAAFQFFESKIRPILADQCYGCHSVTAKKLKGKLYADSLQGLLTGGESGPALVPGQPEKSRLIEAIGYKNQDLQMPPDSKLTDAQIADLSAWIKRGAPWPKEAPPAAAGPAKVETFNLEARKASHWAWQPIKPQTPPPAKNPAWIGDPLDAFVLQKLDANKLVPAAPADKRALIRRATFDLIGLPPTPDEVEAFANDNAPNAFEKVIDHLLASPHFGERWARHWMDLVRYADTYGHEFDFELPNAYQYRDYLIRAFNADVPYNTLAVEHIAGDLLGANARTNPASGFNESVIGTCFFNLGESVHSPVDVRQHQADRLDNMIDVTGKTFLGMTIACARCHDHKFDAISTADYYALFGYLKSTRYAQVPINAKEIEAKAAELAVLKPKLAALAHAGLLKKAESLSEKLAAFKPAGKDAKFDPLDPLYPWIKMNGVPSDKFAAKWTDLRAELKKHLDALETIKVSSSIPDLAFRSDDPAIIRAGGFVPGTTAERPIAEIRSTNWTASDGLSRKLQGAARSKTFRIENPYIHILAKGRGARISLVIDNYTLIRSPIYGGLRKHLNSDKLQWTTIDVSMWQGHEAYLEFTDSTTPFPGEDGHALTPDDYFAVRKVVFSEHRSLGVASDAPMLSQFINSVSLQGNNVSLRNLADWYLLNAQAALHACGPEFKDVGGSSSLLNALLERGLLDLEPSTELDSLFKNFREIEASIPAPVNVPAVADGNGIDEHIFIRGSPKNPGPLVHRRFLTALNGTENDADPNSKSTQPDGSNRFALAKKMTAPENPLFARVIVNRLWHHLFGRGIVASVDNFGKLGEEPTHPELLDFLAARFTQNGPDDDAYHIKSALRRILLSSTYRMSSSPNPANDANTDPANKLLAHQRIKRLEGEAIRDAMLSVSGRLDKKMFGPGIDAHLTPFMTGRGRPSSGPLDGAGRRSIYTNVRRNFLPPMMLAFDTPVPFSAMGRRTVSNVPAQALMLLNDPFVLGQAELWAQRESRLNTDFAARVTSMYRTAFARDPLPNEINEAHAFIDAQIKDGTKEPDAWKDYAHVLMNAKEFIFVK